MNIQSSKIYRIIFVIYNRFFDDRLTYAASALVYSTLFAIVPLFAVCFGIFSAFPAFHSVSDQVQTFISQNFIPASGAIIQDYIKVFILQATKLSLIGTVFLIIAAMFLLITIEDVFSQIWHVEKRRQTLYAWLSYWAILSLAPILIGISVASSSYIMSLNLVSNILNNFELKQHLLWIFPFAFMLIAFTLLYIVAPNCRVPFRYAFFGAFISTSLFEILKRGFVWYMAKFPTYQFIYGSVALFPIFLFWLYLSWVIILFGALISHILTTHLCDNMSQEDDPFLHAFLWLGYLWQAQKYGKSLSMDDLYSLLPVTYKVDQTKQLEILESRSLIHTTINNEYILSRDFSKMTLGELYQTLPWKLPDLAQFHSEKIKYVFNNANEALEKPLGTPLADLYGELFK